MKKIVLIVGIVVVIIVVVLLMWGENISTPVNNPENESVSTVSQNNVLNLSNKGLTSIPMDVFSQTNLEELNVSHNNLTGSIQSQVGQLKNLKVLNASYNKMTGVPAEIGQLQNLESLDLSYNQLTGLPQELGNLQKLKILNLTGNSYSQQDLDYIRDKLPVSTIIILK
jgi:Leucine-rich repeat (LRR) protein